MTPTEQAIQDLRNALKAELIETAQQWWAERGKSYIEFEDTEGAVSDLLITLEQA
jgi:hypothetical protein